MNIEWPEKATYWEIGQYPSRSLDCLLFGLGQTFLPACVMVLSVRRIMLHGIPEGVSGHLIAWALAFLLLWHGVGSLWTFLADANGHMLICTDGILYLRPCFGEFRVSWANIAELRVKDATPSWWRGQDMRLEIILRKTINSRYVFMLKSQSSVEEVLQMIEHVAKGKPQ